MTTLREDVIDAIRALSGDNEGMVTTEMVVNEVSYILEATGAPAYCRVATDLRGEWVEPGRDFSSPLNYEARYDR